MGKATVYPRNKRSFFGLILAGLFSFFPRLCLRSKQPVFR